MIKIISVGKIKESYLLCGIDEYKKRLNKFTKLEFIEVKDEEASKDLSEAQENIIKDIEGDRILSHIKNEYVVCLDRLGEELTSIELSKKIEWINVNYSSNITFIIGGSLGLSRKVLERGNYKLSFSKMTFPHQLFKLILLEQIYRAYKIMNNETYHK